MSRQWLQALEKSFQAMCGSGDFTITRGEREWKIHQMVLSIHSPVLAKMCEGQFKEAQKRLIDLSHEHHELVNCMINFFYLGNLVDDTQNFFLAEFVCRMYILADQFDVPHLKELALEEVKGALRQSEDRTLIKAAAAVYEASLVTKPLRSILVAEMVKRGIGEADGDKSLETLSNNTDFVLDLATAYREHAAELKQKLSTLEHEAKVDINEARKLLNNATLKVQDLESAVKSQTNAMQALTGGYKHECYICGCKMYLSQATPVRVTLRCPLCKRDIV